MTTFNYSKGAYYWVNRWVKYDGLKEYILLKHRGLAMRYFIRHVMRGDKVHMTFDWMSVFKEADKLGIVNEFMNLKKKE